MLAVMQPPAASEEGFDAVRVSRIRRYRGNILYTLQLSRFPDDLAVYKGGFGLFFETEAKSAAQLFGGFSARMQTVVCIGISPQAMAAAAAAESAAGALRFVPAGQALQIDTVWDGIDLIGALSRKIF